MRILIDECLPRRLAREFSGYDVLTVVEMGWSGKKNGELLELMLDGGFDVFLTADQNVQYQQNLRKPRPAIVVLRAASNRLADLLPLMDLIFSAVARIKPGELIEVGPPA